MLPYALNIWNFSIDIWLDDGNRVFPVVGNKGNARWFLCSARFPFRKSERWWQECYNDGISNIKWENLNIILGNQVSLRQIIACNNGVNWVVGYSGSETDYWDKISDFSLLSQYHLTSITYWLTLLAGHQASSFLHISSVFLLYWSEISFKII